MTPTIPYDAILARADRCLAISRERAVVADFERAARYRRYAEALVDLLEIDRHVRGESWVAAWRETLEDRLGRVRATLAGPAMESHLPG